MKGLPRSLAHANPEVQAIRRQKIPLNAFAIRTTGATGVGWGTAVLGDFPDGNILFLAAIAYLQLTKTDSGTTATFDGDVSIGTVPAASASLATTKSNIVGSTSLGAATAGLSPVVRCEGSTAVILDNTDGSLELNLNLMIDDAAISADDQDFTVNGYVDILYSVLGDD